MSEFEIVIYLLVGLVLLVLGGEGLVRGSSSIALRFGVSPLVIGLTIVAFGTSSPELLVSLQAVLNGNSDISLGNVIGSNIGNIGLILAVSALIRPLTVQMQIIKREIPFMIFVSVLITIVIIIFSVFSFMLGIVFTAILIAYIFITLKNSKNEKIVTTDLPSIKKEVSLLVSVFFVLGGLLSLIIGSDLFVKGSVSLAKIFGVSDLVIGLTIVAIGTSLPELVTSVVAAIKNETDIAIGNVVGSNIFNILGILGITGIVGKLSLESINLVDLGALLLFVLIILPLSKTQFVLQRWEGGLLLALYVGYISYLIA